MADDEIREGDPELPRRKNAPPSDDEDDDDRPRRRRRRDNDGDREAPEESALGAVVPLGVSVWALVSLYSALLSCVIPGLGLVAIIAGILAFVTHKQKATYGSVSGNIRAIIGIVLGLSTFVIHVLALIAFLMAK
jgi:hypothetical protein